jgi:hypothetical protein
VSPRPLPGPLDARRRAALGALWLSAAQQAGGIRDPASAPIHSRHPECREWIAAVRAGDPAPGEAHGHPSLPGCRFLHLLGEDLGSRLWLALETTAGRPLLVEYRPFPHAPFEPEAQAAAAFGALFLPTLSIVPSAAGTCAIHSLQEPVELLRHRLDLAPRPLDPAARERHRQELMRILIELGRDLEPLHEQGRVHGNLHPGRILVTGEGRARLIGLGWRLPPVPMNEAETTTDLEYLAPEVLDPSGPPPGPGADVFSLGVLLFEILDGRRPFRAMTRPELAGAMRAGAPGLYHARGLPNAPAVLTALARALAPDPAKRFASAGELAEALARAEFGETQEGVELRRRRVGPILRFLLLACVLLGAGAFVLSDFLGDGTPAARPSIVMLDLDLPGDDFGQRVQALPPGTRILLAGNEGPDLVLRGRGLQVQGLNASGTSLRRVIIEDLPAGQEVTIETLRVRGGREGPAILVRNAHGRVVFRGVRLDVEEPGQEAILLERAGNVEFEECSLSATVRAGPGSALLRAEESHLTLRGSHLQSRWAEPGLGAAPIAPVALLARGTTILAADSTLVASAPLGTGAAPALRLLAGQGDTVLRHLRCLFSDDGGDGHGILTEGRCTVLELSADPREPEVR